MSNWIEYPGAGSPPQVILKCEQLGVCSRQRFQNLQLRLPKFCVSEQKGTKQ